MSQLFCYFLVFCLFLSIRLPVFAQQIRQKFEHISIQQGLSQSVINCIFQDSRGYIWIGTQQGLNKYDGYTFTSYVSEESNPGSISGNTIRCIYEDSKGKLWIGTEGKGLNEFNRETEKFQRFIHQPANPQSLLDNTILSVLEDSQGKLYIGTRSGLQTMHKGTFETIQLSHQVGKLSINCLLEDKTQQLWVGSETALFRLNKFRNQTETFLLQADSSKLNQNEIHCMFETKNGLLLIGTNRGLKYFNKATHAVESFITNTPENKLLADSEIYAIVQDNTGNIWISTFGNGLIKLNLSTQTIFSYTHDAEDKESISSDAILALLIDQSGLLWAGTYEGKLDKLNLLRVRFNKLTYQPADSNSLISNEVYAVMEDKKGYIWIGTDNGLSRYDKKSQSYLQFQHKPADAQSLSNNIIYCILEDKQGNIWIGTAGGGLNKINARDLKNGVFKFQVFSPSNNPKSEILQSEILTLFEDKLENLWVGTSSGLCIIDKKNAVYTYTHQPNKEKSLTHNEVLSIHQGKSGKIWIGTSRGLNHFNLLKRNFTRYINKKSGLQDLSSNTIYSIHEDTQGNVWLGTDGGLCSFHPGQNEFTLYTVKDGLPDNVIYGILEDQAHHLWVSTNKGLGKVIKSNTSSKTTFVNYNNTNGLHCNAFNIGAYHAGRTGELSFGCNEGLTFFHPSEITGNTYIPPVTITDFQLFFEPVQISKDKESPLSKAISETRKLVLKYNQNVLYFEFAALNFIENEKNEYAFFMEGFDKDWNYVKHKRNATYTNLDPGTYVFKVKASNNDGVWNEEGTSLEIIIKPPFYRQNWFYVICVAGLIFAITGYVRYHTQELEKNERILVQKVQERTEEVIKQKEELETTIKNLKSTQAQLLEAEKMASLGILTAGVAHEINNPINFVSANIEPLKQDIADMLQVLASYEAIIDKHSLNDTFKEVETLKQELGYQILIQEINDLLNGIKEGASRTSEIVKGLRNFSRLDESDMKPINVNEGIESTLMVLSNQFKNRIKVTKELSPVEELMGYPGKLNQVFMNIISNACQAIPAYGEIIIKTYMQKSNIVISIADNGVGMTEDVKKRIFEPFFTTKKVGAGTGLGLSISYGIIKDHNGHITVESEPGKGTTFKIIIPTGKI